MHPPKAIIDFIIFCLLEMFNARRNGCDIPHPKYLLDVRMDVKKQKDGILYRSHVFSRHIVDGLVSNGISPEDAQIFAYEFLVNDLMFKSQSLRKYVTKAVRIGTKRLDPRNKKPHNFDPSLLEPLFVFSSSCEWDGKLVRQRKDKLESLMSKVMEIAKSCEVCDVCDDISATIDLIAVVLSEFYPDVPPSRLWLDVLFTRWYNLADIEYFRCILHIFSRTTPCYHSSFVNIFSRFELRIICSGIRLTCIDNKSIQYKVGCHERSKDLKTFMVVCSEEEKQMYQSLKRIFGDNLMCDGKNLTKSTYVKYKEMVRNAENENRKDASRLLQSRIVRLLILPIEQYFERIQNNSMKVVQAFIRTRLAMGSELGSQLRFEMEKQKSKAILQAVTRRLNLRKLLENLRVLQAAARRQKIRKLLDVQEIARQKLQSAGRLLLAKCRIRAARIDGLICPICYEKSNMVVYECGHYSCESCHDHLMYFKSPCHTCRQIINDGIFVSSQSLKLRRKLFPGERIDSDST